MRTREELMKQATFDSIEVAGQKIECTPVQLATLEVLLDIRDLLQRQADEAGRCGHGVTGVCMACVMTYDLMRPRG